MRTPLLYNRPRGARATGIIIRNNRLLLMKLITPTDTLYNLPGGGWEFGEVLEESLKREIMEEFNLQINPGKLVSICDSADRINFIFDGKCDTDKIELGGEEKERNSKELTFEPVWIPLSELNNINIQPLIIKEVINKYLVDTDQPTFYLNEVKEINKNILIVAPTYLPIPVSGYGGIERIVSQIYELYYSAGYNVDIVSHPDSKYHTYDAKDLDKIDYDKYRFILSYNYKEPILKELNKHNPVLYIIFQNNYKDSLKFVEKLYHINPFVLSIDQQKQYTENLALSFPIIPNGVDTSIFDIKQATGNRPKDIVFIGAIGQHKSPLACLRYAKKHNLAIDFYGPIIFSEEEAEYKEQFENEVKEYKKCNLLGETKGESEKVNILNSYKYFIFLPSVDKKSWVEPFGIAPLEAMACGCTVITQLEVGGHKSFCNDKNTIDYKAAPTIIDPSSIRKSILNFDIKDIFLKFYPK